ncbi:hypothetical protein AMTRI_Chr03g43330 [Amborella trichopoda]
MDCLSNVAAMRDIVFQVDFLARMLLFHLVLALVIILEVGASLLLMNSDAHYMVTFLVSNNKNNLIMRYRYAYGKAFYVTPPTYGEILGKGRSDRCNTFAG